MNPSEIGELLTPYIVGLSLPPAIYGQLGAYLDLLLRWNAKTNLTSIRDPKQIVTRHFGESLFAAGVLFGLQPPGAPLIPADGMSGTQQPEQPLMTLADLGSGAGFPGIPIKLACPELQVTLLESQNKKATFLKEVVRMLGLKGIEVYNGRAGHWGQQVDVVTLRAVERFESMLPVGKSLVVRGGRLCVLMGRRQRDAFASIADVDIEVEQSMPNTLDSEVIVGNCH